MARGATPGTKAAAAILLAAIASRNPETHAFVAMQSGTPLLLMRMIQALPQDAPLELFDAFFACLSVNAGDSLPSQTITSPVLQHHLGGPDLLNLLAYSIQVRGWRRTMLHERERSALDSV